MPIATQKTLKERIESATRACELFMAQPSHLFAVIVPALSLAGFLYGRDSDQYQIVKGIADEAVKCSSTNQSEQLHYRVKVVLNAMKSDMEAGLTANLRAQVEAEVLSDFTALARQHLAENKDVSAVLAAAAFEDSIKRYAAQNNITTEGKVLNDLLGALKAAGKMKAPQASAAQGFREFRNKAMHAQWDKIDKAEVAGCIAFVEQFLAERFTS